MHSQQDDEKTGELRDHDASSADANKSEEHKLSSSETANATNVSSAESSSSTVTDGVGSDPDGPVTSTFPFLGAPNS